MTANRQDSLATMPENLPSADHIRELAQEAVGQIMEQAQVFASAWSLVGGRFDSGNGLSDAEDAKAELKTMVSSLADLAAETVRPQAVLPAADRQAQAAPVVTFGVIHRAGDGGVSLEYIERDGVRVREAEAKPKPEICANCDTALPEGCCGLFATDPSCRVRASVRPEAPGVSS